jgi:3-methyladenine DNA glycosylase AlkD
MGKKAESAVAPRRRKAAGRKAAVAATAPPDAPGILARLTSLGDAAAAEFAQRFFKTGPGEYGEGDKFIGVRVPVLRQVARDLRGAGIEVALPLLKSSWHEARLLALFLLVNLYSRADESTRKRIFDLYLKSTKFINGWDLVDSSAAHIVGAWLADKAGERKKILTRLAKSDSLWERRIAMLATYHYIVKGEYRETFRIAEILIKDNEDLIHKAVGWMLREVGQRIGEDREESFLKEHYQSMPRTMLRYAIERFAEPKRKKYLAGLV